MSRFVLCSSPHLRIAHALVLVLCLAVAFAPKAFALAPLSGHASDADALTLEWRLKGAARALQSGLATLAEAQYRELLAKSAALSAEQVRETVFGLTAARIAREDYASARASLDALGEHQSSRRVLYETLIVYGEGSLTEMDQVANRYDAIEPGRLPSHELSWYHFLTGVLAERDGRPEAAGEAFRRAREQASSPEQAAFFESLVLRRNILSAESPDERLLARVRQKLEDLRGQSAAYPFVKEYALLLYRMNRVEEAVVSLEAELAAGSEVFSGEERSQLLLLKAMMLGPESAAGREALEELVRSGRGKEAMAVALQLLVRSADEPGGLLTFLSQVIAQSQTHPLIVQLYYLRAQLALSDSETAAVAEADAKFLLEQYPGARELADVYGLLAYAALLRDPPQYRAAAEYLSQLRRDRNASGEDGFRLNRLIGDCYFLNGDFANAVDFYRSAQGEMSGPLATTEIFLRLAVAEMKSGQLEEAIRYVDGADFGGAVSQTDRWMAEWNLSQALLQRGELARARTRVADLLATPMDDPVPTALDLRLRWLALHLRMLAGETSGLSAEVAELVKRIESVVANTASDSELDLLTAELMLLQGKALLAEGQVAAGISILRTLRETYPGNSAAERTFMAEASFRAANGDLRAAQTALIALAENYPESDLAAQALFEAALYCERRGPDYFGEAIVILDRLVEDYADEAMRFHAGLKQGDLLRLMNDYASAQLLYENLINTYPEHPLRHVAELARADCLFALAGDDPNELADAAAVLERLLDLPDLTRSLQMEIGYKLGLVLQRRGALEEAKATLGLMTTDFLLDPERVLELGELGQYWLSRAVFELGTLLEDGGNREEARRLYRKMIAFNLPGRSIAKVRLGQLSETGVTAEESNGILE